jgi:extradiol dioxygenase family protein
VTEPTIAAADGGTPQRSARPFHLALPVTNLARSRAFYLALFGCPIGRSDERWVDLDFFGHQLVLHQVEPGADGALTTDLGANDVDREHVPVPHFGVVLAWEAWHALADELRQQTEVALDWIIEPTVRFEGRVGEQATMFVRDPDGWAIELKAFRDDDDLFRPFAQSSR